jgi:ABC-type glycerol-3-phosphate transport system substrate-binding protein
MVCGRAAGRAAALKWWVAWVAAALLVGCAPSQATRAPTETPSPEPTIATLTPVPSDTPEPEVSRLALRLWLVEPLAPGGEVPAVLLEQVEAFRADHANVNIDVRVKLADGVDGVLAVLRSATSVAPGVLPDLVLLSRADLVSAANEALLQKLEGRLRQVMLSDWFPVTLEMASVGGELYGVPYVLDGQHLAYRETALDGAPTRFDDVLAGPPPYLFPAGSSDAVLGQYLAGGGVLVGEDGQVSLDRAVLLDVLDFYEAAVRERLIPLTVLEYDSPNDYVESFVNGMSSLANVSAATYLQRRSEMLNTGIAPVPAREGASVMVVTGWSWALVTADPDRQVLVLELLHWLMRPENQGAFTRMSGVLPSRRAALQIWGDDAYSAFAEALLENAVPRPAGEAEATAARALQDALRDVLLGRLTAEEATDTAIGTVSGSGS